MIGSAAAPMGEPPLFILMATQIKLQLTNFCDTSKFF